MKGICLSLFLLVAVSGCGPSYADLLQVYENESKELERLKASRKEVEELRDKTLAQIEAMRYEGTVRELVLASDKAISDGTKAIHDKATPSLHEYDQQIAVQKARVDAAWSAKEKKKH